MLAPNRFLQFFMPAILFLFLSCNKKDSGTPGPSSPDVIASYLSIPTEPYNYANQSLPAHLLAAAAVQDNSPADNRVTDWGATLGRVLFYDKNLSANRSISCASCHNQQTAFTDNLVFSKGFNNGLTDRNSMSLVNARFYPNGRYFWDERAATLEVQTLLPIQHPVEMGMSLDTLVPRLQALPYYPYLFEKAFGNSIVSSQNIARALAQFTRSIISYQSKYDAGRSAFPANQPPGQPEFPNFTTLENRGKQIFFGPLGGCAGCHGSETFTAPAPKNNGLDMVTVDRGVGGITNMPAREGLFKVPSLKDVDRSGPYMHDGRFATLEQVVEHYSIGVQPHPNLSPELRLPNGQPRNANLSTQDKAALVAFLRTLTDPALATDVRFSNPFK